MFSRSTNACALMLMLLSMLPFSGCGSGEQFQAVSGTVTVDGEPLKKGIITFFAIGEGSTSGGEVIDGSYSLAADRGPSPGKYRVEITGSRPTGKTEFDIDLKKKVDVEEQFLPPRYHAKSELTAEVVASGENKFDFALKAK